MIVKLYPQNPDERLLKKIIKSLQAGEIIIVPTDTIYAFCCDIKQQKAFEKICRIKQVHPEKATFSVVCQDLSHISEYTRPIPNYVFKVVRKALPGPYTFILEANKNIPRIFHSKRSTVGIRITSDKVTQLIAATLGNPLVVSSVHEKDMEEEYFTNPELIHEKYEKQISYLLDGGTGHNIPSTVVDFSSGEAEIIRIGAGSTDIF